MSNIRLFGSVARDEADDRSDLDLLVAVEPGRTLLDLASFAVAVEDLRDVITQVSNLLGETLRDDVE